ncbi:MAG: TauD/TfdA family dioxygenase [Betaproteobacteria bacterium]|nr:TauD/TfdA family dioxygenase [Betaproteobacteria bacterium]
MHVLNEYHKAEHPEIFELSNIGADGKPNAVHPDLGTLFWHSDASYQKRPALATLLYAEQAPASGGHAVRRPDQRLGSAGRRRARALPDAARAARPACLAAQGGLCRDDRRAAAPLAAGGAAAGRAPPGRNALYLGSHGQEFVGLAPLASRGLFERIMNHCTEPRFVYEHVWQAGDLVMWDNRATVHRGTGYDTAAEPQVKITHGAQGRSADSSVRRRAVASQRRSFQYVKYSRRAVNTAWTG